MVALLTDEPNRTVLSDEVVYDGYVYLMEVVPMNDEDTEYEVYTHKVKALESFDEQDWDTLKEEFEIENLSIEGIGELEVFDHLSEFDGFSERVDTAEFEAVDREEAIQETKKWVKEFLDMYVVK